MASFDRRLAMSVAPDGASQLEAIKLMLAQSSDGPVQDCASVCG